MPVAWSEALGLFVGTIERDGRLVGVTMRERDEPRPPTSLLARILAHLDSGKDDFADVPLALAVSEFDRKVLDTMRAVPPGRTWTYGELTARAGLPPTAARAVGGACARNPAPIVVPCHRVIAADGGLVNYSGAGGVATKRRLLEIEGALKPERGRQTALF